MSNYQRKNFVYRPKPISLESLAISRGIVESPASAHPLVEKLRLSLATRGTDGSGFCDLQRRFNAIDRDGSRTLFLDEFKIAFQRSNFNFTDQEISTLFYLFDVNDKKYLDYEEFMIGIRGPINEKRRHLIDKAFQHLDIDGRGLVDPEEVIDRYDPTNHPDVKSGLKKAQDVFRDFLRSFDVSTEVDGKITRTEFENYYLNFSASVERDDYFEQAICNAWHINGLDDDWEANHNRDRENYRSRIDSQRYTDRSRDNNNDNRPRTLDELAYEKESQRSGNYRDGYARNSTCEGDSPSRSAYNYDGKYRYISTANSGTRSRSASPGSRTTPRGRVRPLTTNSGTVYQQQLSDRERFERVAESEVEIRN